MDWKKNFFGYFMWLLYTVAVGSSLFCIIALLGSEMGYSLPISLVLGSVCLIVAGGLVFFLRYLGKKIGAVTFESKTLCFILEGIAITVLLAVGIILCLKDFPQVYVGEEYFELAKITERQGVIQVVHGAMYLFLQLLHVICMFFGNKITVCIITQMILYVITAVILYFALRRLSGVLPAIVVLAFMMLSASLNQNARILSPNVLFLFFYASSLHLIATCLKKSRGSILKYLFTGIVIAFLTYLDVMGLTLLIFVISLFYAKRPKALKVWNKPVIAVLICMATALAGFFGCIALDAILSGKEFFSVLVAWGNLYYPEAFLLPISVYVQEYAWDGVILLGLLALGIFSFFYRKKVEKLSVWIFAALVFVLMECFQITTPEMNAIFYIYICLAVMAGIGIANVFAMEDKALCQEEEPMQEKETVLNETVSDDVAVNEKPEENTVQFIENPLPLPKKHVAKTMDFKIKKVESAELDFDFDIDDSDDYDI